MTRANGEHKTFLITGASTGIGRACALDLDRRGFTVFATIRRAEDGEALAAEASKRLRPIFLDVTDRDSIHAAAATVADAVGEAGLDGLVNNAGIAMAGPLEAMDIERLRRQLDVNVTGQVAVTQAFLPLLRAAQGRIVNMGSIGGLSVIPFVGAYCASKFALEALTDALRMELKPWGMEVSIIEPGSVATPIWRKGVAHAEASIEGQASAETLYGTTMDRMRKVIQGTGEEGAPPQAVAEVVHHALTARRPKTRYLVGRMAHVRALLQRLPDRLRDRLILRRLTGG